MAELSIESLGISRDEIVERLVDRLADKLLRENVTPFDDDEADAPTLFANDIRERVMAKANQAIEEIAARNVLPNVASYVENLCLQETNKWGEKVGAPVTFTEYLVSRAERYLTETVDFQGKNKAESGSYSWSGTQTRLTHLVHHHLHFAIEKAMKEAIASANKVIVDGLEKTVRLKMAEVGAALKVEVKTR